MLKKITKWETEDGKVFDTQEDAEDYMFEQEKEVMTHTSTEQPEALRLAAMYDYGDPLAYGNQWKVAVCTELRRLHARVQELEQASRRAPAVPVLQSIEQMAVDRYKVVPSHSSMFYPCAVVAGDGQQQLYIGRAVECQNMARKFTGAFLDGAFVALAAVPQSPEVAPVQMPEPSAWMLGCQTMGGDVDWKLSWSKSGAGVCHRLNGKEFEQPLYTEQQVIDLLKSVGCGC